MYGALNGHGKSVAPIILVTVIHRVKLVSVASVARPALLLVRLAQLLLLFAPLRLRPHRRRCCCPIAKT